MSEDQESKESQSLLLLEKEEISQEITNVASMKEQRDWFIVVDAGSEARRYYGKEEVTTALRASISEGKYQRNSEVLVYSKDKNGKWSQTNSNLFEFAKNYFGLRVLYQPVWSHAMEGLKWGVIVGIILKLLDTLILLGSVDPILAILFLVAIGVCFIPRIGIVGTIMISVFMARVTHLNFFMMALAAALVGAILGCLPGMAIGGMIGFSRKSSLPRARDAEPEPDGLFMKTVLLPLVAGCALLIFYVCVFNPWLVTLLK